MVYLCDVQHTVRTYHKGKVLEMRNLEEQVQYLRQGGHIYADPQGAKVHRVQCDDPSTECIK